MAAVSLGDLMNPLSKIARYSEESNMILSSLSDFLVITVSSMKNTSQRLLMVAAAQADLLAMIEKNTGKTLFTIIGNLLGLRARMIFRGKVTRGLENIQKLLKTGGSGKKEQLVVKDKSVATFIKEAGIGLFNFARALAKAVKIKPEAADKFINYTQRLLDHIRSLGNDKKLKKGAKVFTMIADTIKRFTTTMFLASILMITGITAAPLINLAIKIIGNALFYLGKNDKQIKKGAITLKTIEKSILNLSLALAVAVGTVLIAGDPMIVIKAIGILTLAITSIGFAAFLIGSLGKNVITGSKAIKFMGQGLFGFSKGLAVILLVTPLLTMIPVKALFLMFLTIVGVGFAIAALGMVDKNIKKGAKVTDLIGKALKSFAIGIALLALASFIVPFATKTLMFIVGTGLFFAFLGSQEKRVKKGAVSLIIMSVALGLFTIGYYPFIKAIENTRFEDIIKASFLLISLGIAFILFGKVKNPLKATLAMSALGVGLLVFSIGYKPFAQATNGVSIMNAITQIIIVGGLLGTLFIAAKIGIVNSLKGTVVLAALGVGLLVFSIGYKPFAQATKGMTIMDSLAQIILIGGLVGVAILGGLTFPAPLLGALAIAAIGVGLLIFSLGYKPFAKATSEETIETVGAKLMLVGGLVAISALAGILILPIALSVLSFGFISLALFALSFGLGRFKAIGFTPSDTDNLVYALTNILSAFGGNPPGGSGKAGGEGGFLGFLGELGASIGKIVTSGLGAISVVINALSFIVISGALIALAQGLKIFKESGFTSADTDILKGVLKMLLDVFGGGDGKETVGSNVPLVGSVLKLGDKVINTVSAGVGAGASLLNSAALLTISQILPSIAEGLKSFSDANWTPAKTNILRATINDLMDIFSQKRKSIDKLSLQSFGTFVSYVEKIGMIGTKGSLEKAAAGISKISSAISSIDIEKTDSLTKFFKASADFSGNDKSKAALEALAEAVKEIRDIMVSEANTSQPAEGGMFSSILPNEVKTTTGTLGGGSADLSATLSQINSTLANLPSAIASIEIRIPER